MAAPAPQPHATPPMDLKLLRCFVTLADVGNVRRASALLAVTQPALSMRIQRLEEDIGYPLFHRQAGGVSLTERGARLLPHVQRLLDRAEATAEAARLIGHGAFDRLEIGMTPIAALSFLPVALRHYLAAHPQVHVALTEGVSDELEEAVAHRALDFAIVHPPSPRDDLVEQEVARERYLAVVPAGHRLATAAAISADDLRQEPIVLVRRDVGQVAFDRLTGWLGRDGPMPRLHQSASTSITLIGLVAAGVGIGLVIESLRCVVRDDVRYVPLAGDDVPTLGFTLCHRPDLPDAVRVAFAHSVVSVAAGWRP